MAINGIIVQYTSGFLPYILLFTQAAIPVWLDGTIIDISTILLQCTTTIVYFQVNNGVVYLDYEDSHHHGPLLCSFQ